MPASTTPNYRIDPTQPMTFGVLTPEDYAALASGEDVYVVACLGCGDRIPRAEQDAAAGHPPTEPRCYGCGSLHARSAA